ncbi:MAG: aminotransferase class I/II-fold pyridoxal phosphate-dependent enzyme [Lachnospiraceae bacterium]|jgi:DNA-binding transcriptional MocR family regulator|nr:aminotransferase class I/II-fold pyridoxal phosphate-dependent enzyme [Lachnospiraceae bacterium]
MKAYKEMSKQELEGLRVEFETAYEAAKAKGMKLDMSRGKPASEQLDFASGILQTVNYENAHIAEDGTDCRNYGGLTGIPEARRLVGELMDVPAANVIVRDNSSLNIMHDVISRSVTHGVMGEPAWKLLDKVKFLCPAPGYDRHFAVTEYYGIEMITVPMTATGPDMDIVEKHVNSDETVKGIWCVPKYSNPQGISYCDETVKRFAALRPAAADFRIFWDDAYVTHHLYEEEDKRDFILEILGECEKAGNPDMVYKFCSFSKISFAGAGISAVASSKANLDYMLGSLFFQTIGPDKLNMLRHAKFFRDLDGINAHMAKHAALSRPKFEMIAEFLTKELGGLGIGTWINPRGGYFVSFDSLPGCAKAIIALLKEAGVVMTPAGATYPYGKDPEDTNIRIAPTFPPLAELVQAMELFVLCVKLASVRKLLAG